MFEQAFKNIDDVLWKDAGRNGGEYYTPRPLQRAMVSVVNPKLGETIYDGAAGSCGFLCESFVYLKQTNPRRTTAQDRFLQERMFFGKEKKSLAENLADTHRNHGKSTGGEPDDEEN